MVDKAYLDMSHFYYSNKNEKNSVFEAFLRNAFFEIFTTFLKFPKTLFLVKFEKTINLMGKTLILVC